MINPTLPWLIFIRTSIFLLNNSIILTILALLVSPYLVTIIDNLPSSTPYLYPTYSHFIHTPLLILLALDTLFLLAIYLPYIRRFRVEARHPPLLPERQRRALFRKCLANVENPETYLSLWFLGADPNDIGRENVREFFLWAFLDRDCKRSPDGHIVHADEDADIFAEVEYYLVQTERLLGRPLRPGLTPVRSLRLTVDAVPARFRSVAWFGIVCAVDIFTHAWLLLKGFQYHGLPSFRKRMGVFPPRPQVWTPAGWGRKTSPSPELSYWYRPHTTKTGSPVVFLHGIGIGLLPYIPFLTQINTGRSKSSQTGILALEILPISMRMTTEPLTRPEFLTHLRTILAHHGWDTFTLVSHSYGSVLTTHILRDADLGPRVESVVLTDPVSLLLHLPDIAYNFTRRMPRRANEWQLWFFASMDPGTAHVLARHFFWRENLVWKEELVCRGAVSPLGLENGDVSGEGDGVQRGVRKRKVAVVLSGRDLIVDVGSVQRYLACEGDLRDITREDEADVEELNLVCRGGDAGEGEAGLRTASRVMKSGIELVLCPTMDHSQVFDSPNDLEVVLDVVRRYVTAPSDDSLIDL